MDAPDAPTCPIAGCPMEPVPEVGWICLDHPVLRPANPVIGCIGIAVHENGNVHVNGGGLPSDVVVRALKTALSVAEYGHTILKRRSDARWN